MPRRAFKPSEIRDHAASLARGAARLREADGDPEGATVLRVLSRDIERMRLTADVSINPPRKESNQ